MTDTDQGDALHGSAEAPQEGQASDFAELRSTLPDDLRGAPALAPFTSFEGMARSLVEAQRMVGKRISDASPEELGRYYERHGRPAAPDGYEFTPSDGGGGGAPSQLESEARSWFFDAGLSQRQAEVLYDRWNEFAVAQQHQAQQTLEDSRSRAEEELRREWGRVYDRKVTAAARAVRQLGGDDLGSFLDETGLGNDPRMIRAFARIAEQIGEDSLVGEGGGPFSLSPHAAREEITKAMASPAYFDADHPDHGKAVDRMRDLFAAAYPEISD